jgi:CheY-like chemotaxis protein
MSSEQAPRIVVVDDNPATLYATSRVLRGAGFAVTEGINGEQAFALALKGTDLLILDVNLPDVHGFEVCRRIRSDPRTAHVPVIHVSATFVKETDKAQGLDAGADGYLTHPVEPPVLVATVNAFLRTRLAEDELRLSESKFRAVFQNALSGISLLDKKFAFLDANQAICDLLGRSRGGGKGESTQGRVPRHPVSRAAHAVEFDPAMGAGPATRRRQTRASQGRTRNHRTQHKGSGTAYI